MTEISSWIKDYLHLLKEYPLMYFRHEAPRHYLSFTKEEKAPVILIPGIVLKWGFMKDLGDKISLIGHPVYIVPKLGNGLTGIPRSARIVRDLIDKNKLKNIIVVAHSKGGLIAKYLLVHFNKDNAVKGAIAISTPFSGSSLAGLIRHKSFKELSPDSKLIKDLNSHTIINTKIVSVYPSFDNHIPEGSVLINAENIKVDVKGHHKMLFDKKAQGIIIEKIDKLTKS